MPSEPVPAKAAPSPPDLLLPNPKARLSEQVHEVMRFHHYSLRTEEVYWHWIRRFIFFHNKRHPNEMGPSEVSAFLSHLATGDRLAKVTQQQALNGDFEGDFGGAAHTILLRISTAHSSDQTPPVLTRPIK